MATSTAAALHDHPPGRDIGVALRRLMWEA
jgi:hypothetical protein